MERLSLVPVLSEVDVIGLTWHRLMQIIGVWNYLLALQPYMVVFLFGFGSARLVKPGASCSNELAESHLSVRLMVKGPQ